MRPKSCDFELGALNILIGPHGSGKSTVLAEIAEENECGVYHFQNVSRLGEGLGFYQEVRESHAPLDADGGNLAEFLYRIKEHDTRVFSQITRTIRIVCPFFKRFYFCPGYHEDKKVVVLNWIPTGGGNPCKIQTLSAGSLRFILLAALLLQPGEWMPRVLIIDEIELSQHPFALEVIADIIQSEFGARLYRPLYHFFVCATNSPYLCQSFWFPALVMVNRNEEGHPRLTRCHQNDSETQDFLSKSSILFV